MPMRWLKNESSLSCSNGTRDGTIEKTLRYFLGRLPCLETATSNGNEGTGAARRAVASLSRALGFLRATATA